MDGTDPERRRWYSINDTRGCQNDLSAVIIQVATRVERGDSEVGEVGVGSGSQTLARVGVFTLRVGSSEDGGDSEEGGDQELSVEEHRENERRG